MAFKKVPRSTYLASAIVIDVVMNGVLLLGAARAAEPIVILTFALAALGLDVVAWKLVRWALLGRGALAVVTGLAAIANISRALSPGTFDVVLLGPAASAALALESLVLAVPCLRTYDRLTPKFI